MTRSQMDVLLAPVRGRDRSGRFWIERRTLPDGRIALPVYTSVAALVRCCGPDQRWIGLNTAGMATVRRDPGYDVVLVDPDLPDRTEPQSVQLRRVLHDPLGRAGR